MIIAQCDAVISIVDDNYYDRAWCSVEVMMIQTLRKTYNIHLWYEQIPSAIAGTWELSIGPSDFVIDIEDKQLTFEEDKSKLRFLARQCRLLGSSRAGVNNRRSSAI